MHFELTNEQTEALIRELTQIIQNDRYPLSPRIVALKEILGMMRPEPEREPLRRWTRCRGPPPLKVGRLAAISSLSLVDGSPEIDT